MEYGAELNTPQICCSEMMSPHTPQIGHRSAAPCGVESLSTDHGGWLMPQYLWALQHTQYTQQHGYTVRAVEHAVRRCGLASWEAVSLRHQRLFDSNPGVHVVLPLYMYRLA